MDIFRIIGKYDDAAQKEGHPKSDLNSLMRTPKVTLIKTIYFYLPCRHDLRFHPHTSDDGYQTESGSEIITPLGEIQPTPLCNTAR